MNHDPSVLMFWAGALMVFTPLLAAGVVVFVIWRSRKKRRPPPDIAGHARPEA